MKEYKFSAKILPAEKKGGAYVIFPYDIRKEFGKGRVKVDVLFEDISYQGSIVNMGVKDEEGNICYIIGVLKSIRESLGKSIGDTINVVVTERSEEKKDIQLDDKEEVNRLLDNEDSKIKNTKKSNKKTTKEIKISKKISINIDTDLDVKEKIIAKKSSKKSKSSEIETSINNKENKTIKDIKKSDEKKNQSDIKAKTISDELEQGNKDSKNQSKVQKTSKHKTDVEHKIFSMPFSNVYPYLLQKVVKKGRTKEELDEVICWLTGYDKSSLQKVLEDNLTYREFFANAPYMNEKASLITGSICGVKIQEIENPLMKNIRYLDKLVDELAKGKSMDKVLKKGE